MIGREKDVGLSKSEVKIENGRAFLRTTLERDDSNSSCRKPSYRFEFLAFSFTASTTFTQYPTIYVVKVFQLIVLHRRPSNSSLLSLVHRKQILPPNPPHSFQRISNGNLRKSPNPNPPHNLHLRLVHRLHNRTHRRRCLVNRRPPNSLLPLPPYNIQSGAI